MKTHLGLLLMVLSAPAFAQKDDEPIPYDDEGHEAQPQAKKRHRAEGLREEDEANEETLAHLDDPNVGVGGDLLAGVMLFESSRGAGVDPRFMFGVRFTWEWGRLIPDEVLREMFFADVTWQYGATADGTTEVRTDTNQHYFTVSPAVALPLGKSFLSAYAQLGVGFNYDFSSVHLDQTETQLSGTKPLFQYGLGLRGRPALLEDRTFRLEFRVEVTRFLRGYMSDTFLGGSLGVVF